MYLVKSLFSNVHDWVLRLRPIWVILFETGCVLTGFQYCTVLSSAEALLGFTVLFLAMGLTGAELWYNVCPGLGVTCVYLVLYLATRVLQCCPQLRFTLGNLLLSKAKA